MDLFEGSSIGWDKFFKVVPPLCGKDGWPPQTNCIHNKMISITCPPRVSRISATRSRSSRSTKQRPEAMPTAAQASSHHHSQTRSLQERKLEVQPITDNKETEWRRPDRAATHGPSDNSTSTTHFYRRLQKVRLSFTRRKFMDCNVRVFLVLLSSGRQDWAMSCRRTP